MIRNHQKIWMGIWGILVIVCMITIFRFSAQVATKSNTTSTHVTTWVVKIVVPHYSAMEKPAQNQLVKTVNHYVRKGAHFSIYTLLGISLLFFFSGTKHWKNKAKWCSILVGLLYACSDEFHQLFVPGRGAQVRDVLIDTCGVIFGVLIARLILRGIEHRKSRRKEVSSHAGH